MIYRWRDPEYMAAVNKLTNWQRHQWTKNGRRNSKLSEFARLRKTA